jgi:hypothetical protein
MRRKATFLFVMMMVWGCLLVAANSQEDMKVVDNSAFENPQRVSSVFVHEAHNEKAGIEACNQCHHVYEDGKKLEDESSEGESCADCHGPKDDGSKPNLTKAFHRNCKGCHMERKAGPIMCGECHRR